LLTEREALREALRETLAEFGRRFCRYCSRHAYQRPAGFGDSGHGTELRVCL
jgi:hypothetical protein